MTVASKLHPGVIALDERLRILRQGLATMTAKTVPSEAEELEIYRQIEVLQERLALLKRIREGHEPNIANRREEIGRLESLRLQCLEDDRLAQAVWMKLLMQRKHG